MSGQERSGIPRMPLTVRNVSAQDTVSREAQLPQKMTQQHSFASQNAATSLINPHTRSRAALSKLPSFVSRSHFELDRSNQENASVQATTTPKKRAPPLDHAHIRNLPAYSPSKRSRSSVTGTGSSTTEQSTGTTAALANDLNGIRVAESRRPSESQAPPPAPTRPPPQTSAHATAYVKTLRIDKHLRVAENEPEISQSQSEREIWRQKWRRAFPNFIFHFDSMDDATVRSLTKVIHYLGGAVDQFFSRSVTHVITSRSIPDADGDRAKKEREEAHRLERIREARDKNRADNKKLFRPTFLASRASSSKTAGGESSRHRPIPLFSERNPFEERPAPSPSNNDILVKAQTFGIKVWSHEKLKQMLSMLLDKPLRHAQSAEKQDLSQMLEKEKVYGTLERDPNAARLNFHYFPKGTYYLLVEDATMEHRPIMIHEVTYGRDQSERGESPPWPVVYGQAEGRCPFVRHEPRNRDRTPDEDEAPQLQRREPQQSMRRVVSLNNMARNSGISQAFLRTPSSMHPGRGRQEYPLASGNSVSITSNIASTTSTAFAEHHAGMTVDLPQNRRVAELNRRMHTPYAAQHGRTLHASPASVLAGSAGSGLGIHREGGSSIVPVSRSPVPQPEQGATVRRMLGLTRPEVQAELERPGMRRSVSTGTVARPALALKPGYCENCRVKYDDFNGHILSRKHRKFATDDANFVDIDALILRVARRPLAQYDEDEFTGDDSSCIFFEDVPSSQPEDTAFADDEGSDSAGSFINQYELDDTTHDHDSRTEDAVDAAPTGIGVTPGSF
ncbi:hypothetical protein BCV70DRAFT_3501 [Testicularia cyperi]|uniref:DBF4-type domain-containing protein n=1 Tax=Testicularia cyperi TaxID=1882483 RepID=A0A317XXI3_9BASI|nr:hypothetical protein BCV70DRAFT_3501 [Testicularia cyperi]